MINLNNNRHAVAVWAGVTLASSAACFALVAVSGSMTTAGAAEFDAESWNVMHKVVAHTFETCAYSDGWGDVECLQADHEGRPTGVITYEDGSQVSDRAWAGFTQRDANVWVACMPDALCSE